MKKLSALFLALGIASASLSSCSRSDYAFKATTPASQVSEPVAVAAAPKAAQDGLATEAVVVAHAAKPVAAAPVAAAPQAVVAAPVAAAEAIPAQSQEVSAVAATEVAKAPKLNVIQRLALKSVAKKLNKLQDSKQTTAGTAQAQSLKRTSIYLIIAGVLAILVGILVAGGSIAAGGNGAGFVLGVILAYLGYIALVVGVILLIVALVRGH